MRFSSSQYANYVARRADTRQEPPKQSTIDMDAKPTSLEVAGEQALTILHQIKGRGGHVSGMTRGRVNGHWHLSIVWPEHENKPL